MASFTFKAILVVFIVSFVFTQNTLTVSGDLKSFPSPDPSWTEYQAKSCCPKGYQQVRNYCVKCNAPNFFDPVDQKCKPCPEGQNYSKITSRCECFSCDLPRVLNPANGQCQCKVVNGTQMSYNSQTKECVCPSNLPLWNGKYCVACPASTEYDSKEKQCYHCPEGFIRDLNSHSCVPGL